MIDIESPKRSQNKRVAFAVIGGGFSGCLATEEILDNTDLRNTSTLLIEEEPHRYAKGYAYSDDCADEQHQTNIDLKRMFPNVQHSRNDQVAQRRLVGKIIADDLEEAIEIREHLNVLSDAPCDFNKKYGRAIDIEHDLQSGIKRIHFEDGSIVEAENVIIATGNSELRQLPQVTDEKLADPGFENHIMTHQWDKNEKLELQGILEDENIRQNGTIVIVGTALSGDDAVRTLIHSGFQGNIIMMSRNGHRHFEYPLSFSKPRQVHVAPEFTEHLQDYINTQNPEALDAAVASALSQFEQLCGVKYDPKAKTITHNDGMISKCQHAFKAVCGGRLASAFASIMPSLAKYTSEEVFNQWQQYTSLLVEAIGEEAFGKLLGKHSSALNTLRVGAGADVSYEIQMAQKFGGLKIMAASIRDIEYEPDTRKMMVSYTDKGGTETKTIAADYAISSLGPNYNFSRSKDELWNNILERGFTKPHETGLGVHVQGDGSLPGAEGIYVVGPPTAGHRMIKDNVIGPPAFSVPGMRQSIRETVDHAIQAQLLRQTLRSMAAQPAEPPGYQFAS